MEVGETTSPNVTPLVESYPPRTCVCVCVCVCVWTGLPVVLNTSFNENEPIVEHPDDAVDCFLRTKMDVLVLGPYFCRKDRAAVTEMPPCR